MNPEIKTQLLDALRSGNYLKTEGALFRRENDKDYHCALGVLCDLAYKAEVEGVIFDPDATGTLEYYGKMEGHMVVPRPVYDWAGLSMVESMEIFRENDSSGRCSTLNDMADWVETHIEPQEEEKKANAVTSE